MNENHCVTPNAQLGIECLISMKRRQNTEKLSIWNVGYVFRVFSIILHADVAIHSLHKNNAWPICNDKWSGVRLCHSARCLSDDALLQVCLSLVEHVLL